MKKVALVFVLAVFVPSLVLAWLAVRSLRDQQFLLERQQSLLYQGVADAKAKDIQDALAEDQRTFNSKVAVLLSDGTPSETAKTFDDLLRKEWPLAQVGFVVTMTGDILAPSPYGRPLQLRREQLCGHRLAVILLPGEFQTARQSFLRQQSGQQFLFE